MDSNMDFGFSSNSDNGNKEHQNRFIFSDDAVGLENKLHTILTDKRVNKVNMRKEFFNISLDELEQLVTEIEPTAEFNRTMAAEEFRQSQSTDSIYSSDYTYSDDEDDE